MSDPTIVILAPEDTLTTVADKIEGKAVYAEFGGRASVNPAAV